MKIQSEPVKASLQNRLRRMEGQLRGVQKMIDDERDCREILQQLNAVHAALHNATDEFMRTYAKDCLSRLDTSDDQARETIVDNLLDLMAKAR